jgi:hypothetical protein
VAGVTESWWLNGDFTYDGIVDFNDLVKLAQNYNTAPAQRGDPGRAVELPGRPRRRVRRRPRARSIAASRSAAWRPCAAASHGAVSARV